MYKARPETKIADDCMVVYSEIKNSFLSILCGRNNCGKSFILKKLLPELGNKSTFLGPARYNNFNLLSFVGPEREKSDRKYHDLVQHVNRHDHNMDNSPFNLQQAIAELNNEQRKKLVELMKELLGSKMEIRDTDPDNEMSQKYVSVDGFNISYTSSGYRLVASLITSFLNSNHEIFLVDEPELGISPEVQGIFVDFLYNEENRRKYFPHMKSLILATHSPIFLDRSHFKNNYYVQKQETIIHLKKNSIGTGAE